MNEKEENINLDLENYYEQVKYNQLIFISFIGIKT